jgi:hypothetical protein
MGTVNIDKTNLNIYFFWYNCKFNLSFFCYWLLVSGSKDHHQANIYKKLKNAVPYSTMVSHIHSIVRVKQSRNRPGVAQKVPGDLGSQISWHSAREGGEVVNLTHRPPLPPGMFLVLIFIMGWVDSRSMERSEGNMSLQNPVTLSGIGPGTVRIVAQRLNHYTTPSPPTFTSSLYNYYQPLDVLSVVSCKDY